MPQPQKGPPKANSLKKHARLSAKDATKRNQKKSMMRQSRLKNDELRIALNNQTQVFYDVNPTQTQSPDTQSNAAQPGSISMLSDSLAGL